MRWLPRTRLMDSSFSTAERLPKSHTKARLLSALGLGGSGARASVRDAEGVLA
jgi:hypothetical protein